MARTATSKLTTLGPLAPRIPFWEFTTRICGLGHGDSKIRFSAAQRAIWKSIDRKVALTDIEAEAYRELSGKAPWVVGSKAPPFLCQTLTRGGGKTLLLATIAAYEAVTNSYIAAPGETVAVVLLAPRMKQSRDLMRYIKAHFERDELEPLLAGQPVADEIRLKNGRVIRTQAVDKSGGAARGPTYLCALFDESAFLNHDGLVIDEQQWQAVLAGARGVAEFRGVLSSTPNGKSGYFWETFDEYYGRDGVSWEVFQGLVDLVRPDMDPALLQEFQRADEEAYKREFLCDFSAGTGSMKFFVAGQVERAIMQGVVSIEPSGPTSSFTCAVDPSGGAHDVFTVVVIERLEDGTLRQVLARGWDPKESPITVHDITKEIRDLVAPYGVYTVYGDVFGGAWISEAFWDEGLTYETRGFNGQQKVQRASALRESFQSGRLKLLDIAVQTRELCEYEQKTLPSGQISVNHPNTKTGSDDYLDALALAHWEALGHFEEIHPPEHLDDQLPWEKIKKLYKGDEYPAIYHKFGSRIHLTEKEISELGEGPDWILRNWMKSPEYALAAPAELAWWCGLDGSRWVAHWGEDTILQHVWMRWILADTPDTEDARKWLEKIRSFPAIPAWPEIKKRCFVEGREQVVTFASLWRPDNDFDRIGWPYDLFQNRASLGQMGACPPWKQPNPKWRTFPPDEWPMVDWSGDRSWKREIDGLFCEVHKENKERKKRLKKLQSTLGAGPPSRTVNEEYEGTIFEPPEGEIMFRSW